MSAIAESSPPPHGDTGERSLPPVTQLGMTSLAMIVAGGIYLSAHIPNHVPLTPAIILLAGSVLLLATNLFLLSRVPDFPWDRFFDIAKWALLGYTIIAGMIEYAFLRNHLKGGRAGRAHALARGVRDTRTRADRVHGRALLQPASRSGRGRRLSAAHRKHLPSPR